MCVTALKGHIWYRRGSETTTCSIIWDHNMFDFVLWGCFSGAISEVSQGEEGLPEAAFGCVVVQCRDDSGEDEA